MNPTWPTWPCLIVEGKDIRIVGSSLLKDGRYELTAPPIGYRVKVDGQWLNIHPDDVQVVTASR